MQILYPEIKPYNTRQFKVSDLHELYVEESGSKSGIPIVFLHGGPGGGSDPEHRRFFDPEKYRIILFDQRGCGRSMPHAELEANTTQDLINDLEAIRELLEIDKWVLFGGSWGSTYALLYAQAHPDRVKAMILRGIFLARTQDFRWLYQDGANHIYPDYWEDFSNHVPEDEQSDLIEAYYKRLNGADEIARMAAAKIWSIWEGRLSTLQPSHKLLEHCSDPRTALSLARIEAHYMKHDCFIEANQIVDNLDKIQDIPGVIVHGRYDMVCTLDNAYTLHRHWPISELNIVRDAGHSAGEAGNIDALIRATRSMANRFESAC